MHDKNMTRIPICLGEFLVIDYTRLWNNFLVFALCYCRFAWPRTICYHSSQAFLNNPVGSLLFTSLLYVLRNLTGCVNEAFCTEMLRLLRKFDYSGNSDLFMREEGASLL